MRITPARAALPASLQALVGPDGQTIEWPLLEGVHLSCDAGGAAVVKPIEVPDFIAELAPYLQEIGAYTSTENRTTNHQWKIVFQSSTTGRSWNAAVDLFANITANGEATQTPNTSTSAFGRRMRWASSVSASSGTAVEGAVVWAYLALRLRAS